MGRERQLGHRTWMLAGDLHHPVARAHLQPQGPVGLQARRQGTRHRERDAAREQDRSELYLPRPPGHVQVQAGDDPQRDVIVHPAVDLQGQGVALCGCAPGAARSQPQPSVRIAARERHGFSIQPQDDHGRGGRDRQRLRTRAPDEPAGEHVLAGFEPQGRYPLVLHHRPRLSFRPARPGARPPARPAGAPRSAHGLANAGRTGRRRHPGRGPAVRASRTAAPHPRPAAGRRSGPYPRRPRGSRA